MVTGQLRAASGDGRFRVEGQTGELTPPPLRMLIWQDPDGTRIGYLDPRELADRYALDGREQTLERQAAVLTKLAAAAAS